MSNSVFHKYPVVYETPYCRQLDITLRVSTPTCPLLARHDTITVVSVLPDREIHSFFFRLSPSSFGIDYQQIIIVHDFLVCWAPFSSARPLCVHYHAVIAIHDHTIHRTHNFTKPWLNGNKLKGSVSSCTHDKTIFIVRLSVKIERDTKKKHTLTNELTMIRAVLFSPIARALSHPIVRI